MLNDGLSIALRWGLITTDDEVAMTPRSSLPTPLRTVWGLPIDRDDPHGVHPDAARKATLPPELSRAFDRARERVPALGLRADGTPPRLTTGEREAMLRPARAAASEPWPVPLLSQYARFWREGVRTDHESEVRDLVTMTGQAVLAAVATGEHRWIDRAADGILLLCELSSWCWVAHEESHGRRGWVLPDLDAPVIDLGAAEVLHVLVWSDVALGDAFEQRVPGLRERIRREARSRVLDPYLASRRWWWLTGTAHNWTGWIHQHLIAAALLLLDEEDRSLRDAILCLSIAQLDRYLAALPEDGGIDEGIAYFWNGACRLLEALDLLVVTAGGLLDRSAVAQLPSIAALLRYPQRMDLGHGWFVNVADAPARPSVRQPWDVLHRWARHLGLEDVRAQALTHRGRGTAPPVLPELGLGRMLTALGDPAWRRTDQAARPPLPAETWLPRTQLLVARERDGDPSGMALAVKGGHNDEAHNHLDVGSALVAMDSSPVLIDLGRPTYTAGTFDEGRYEIWTMTSSWHTLPEINGHEQGIGPGYRAREVTARLRGHPDEAGPRQGSPAGATPGGHSALELDLAPAYPSAAGVRTYRRRVALELREPDADPAAADRDVGGPSDTARVRITDEWDLEPRTRDRGLPGVVVNHVIAGEIIDHRPGVLRVRALSGSLVAFHWDPGIGTGALERREVVDPLLIASWGDQVHRLRLTPATGPDHRGRTELVVCPDRAEPCHPSPE